MTIMKIKNLINTYSEKRAVMLIVTLTIIVLYILIGIAYLMRPVHVLAYSNASGSMSPFEPILHSNTVIQEFTFDHDITLSGISLQLANYGSIRHNTNQVYIYINDVFLHEALIDSRVVVDNAFYPLDGIDLHISEGDVMRIVITSIDGIPSEAITIWVRSDIISGNRLFRYNMSAGTYEEIQGEISVRTTTPVSSFNIINERHQNVSAFTILFGAILTVTAILFFVMSKSDSGFPHPDTKEDN